ncbi:uncharacterized protein BDZ99DRAFT_461297 [Mytilinidion resinicola]|uniref:Uncharacterized protein n=1 Tax=Mytilinidion resinicola TaxID=574789 RepID=A0A6A6YW78_9PEZI|nr:uncharacterized protein BDZ99DRAFT_461297 [Mytilinidion resinicola]KAF2812643.1 hypothetical protein BDZ99DRAFT_461297 [Mytilinidion resinicola]
MIALLRNIGEDTDSPDTAVYLHGHPQSALMELVKKSDDEQSQPIKVSVTATKGKQLSCHAGREKRWYTRQAFCLVCTPVCHCLGCFGMFLGT